MADPNHLEILQQGVETWNEWRKDNPDINPDLIGADLENANLINANLINADLRKANLINADLRKANLINANFEGSIRSRRLYKGSNVFLNGTNPNFIDLDVANFDGAKINGANLTDANLEILRKGVKTWNKWRKKNRFIRIDFRYANLEGANLQGYDLYDCDFTNANLEGADLQGCDLYDCDFMNANLKDSNLKNTELQGTDFEGAQLSNIDFRSADMIETKFFCAQLRHTDLRGVSLSNSSFERADLSNAQLQQTQLDFANLSHAKFNGTQLQDSSLRGAKATYTNFENANLTGICIEDWNINNQTNLQNVKCDSIFLKHSYSEEEKKWIFSDRRPHNFNKIFAPGEFTQLFQKAFETVDLIFSEGIDWQAFLVSFNKLRIECDSDELSINSFENKGNGAFVIRVNVPDGADKAEIEKYLKKQYQLEATVEAQQRELTNLYEVMKLLARRTTTENRNIQGNYYEQNGNFGAGHIQGNISGEINEDGQPK